MTFGQKIKKLRRDRDITQEHLAELLSISPQAVSRWETDSAMPDISLLAPLANLFDVTTDYLLGVDLEKKNERVREICREVNRIWSEGGVQNWEKAVETVRGALRLYPENWDLKWLLMTLLRFNKTGGDRDKAAECLKEVMHLCEDILANDPDEIHRRKAKTAIISCGKKAGYGQRAEELLKTAPSMHDTTEILGTVLYEGDAKINAEKYVIYCCMQHLYSALVSLSMSEKYSHEERVSFLEKGQKLYELLYDSDDYCTVLDPWIHPLEKADILADCGYVDEAFKVLNRDLERKKALCENNFHNFSNLLLPEEGRTKMFLGKSSSDWRTELTELVDKDDLVFLQNHISEAVRNDPRCEKYIAELIEFRDTYAPEGHT